MNQTSGDRMKASVVTLKRLCCRQDEVLVHCQHPKTKVNESPIEVFAEISGKLCQAPPAGSRDIGRAVQLLAQAIFSERRLSYRRFDTNPGKSGVLELIPPTWPAGATVDKAVRSTRFAC
ncbi:hypothetical protein [Cupriavidus basilensis]